MPTSIALIGINLPQDVQAVFVMVTVIPLATNSKGIDARRASSKVEPPTSAAQNVGKRCNSSPPLKI